MLAAVVVLVAAAVLAGIIAFAGGGFFALIVIPIGIAVAVWLALSGASSRSTADIARDVDSPSMMGPGGPDDPER